ncbi:polyamine oxidase 1 [Citrus sinensis]|uniref:Polyamine oxidase 1 n=1 Tax=Citrus sinensis TaxID=2711 RepID=A0ACB8L748_CITSI|nr:polyamine oxidase 1 [Citrus sinensis]
MKISAVVLALALLLPFTLVIAPTSPPSNSVIIVGAGMSGIMAAKTLEEAGYKDFIILEASSRVGGRLHKGNIGGHTIELGANWVNSGGPKSSPSLQIAKKIKLKTFYSDYANLTSNIYKQDGGLHQKHVVESAVRIAKTRDAFCTNLSKMLSSETTRDDDTSILGSQRLLKEVPMTPLEMAIDYFFNDYEDAEPPRITSLKTTYPRNQLVDFGEDSYFVADPRGFESVVHSVAKQFLSHRHQVIRDPRLKLNKVVRNISYSKDKVTVKTEDGSVYQANYAIVSVSIGVLQSDFIEFTPNLPHLENEMPGSNILFVTVTDEESRRVERQSDEKTKAEIMNNVLRKLFGNKIPEPQSIFVPRWWSNRFFNGSYSNWPNGFTQQSYKELKVSICKLHVGLT